MSCCKTNFVHTCCCLRRQSLLSLIAHEVEESDCSTELQSELAISEILESALEWCYQINCVYVVLESATEITKPKLLPALDKL